MGLSQWQQRIRNAIGTLLYPLASRLDTFSRFLPASLHYSRHPPLSRSGRSANDRACRLHQGSGVPLGRSTV